MTNKVAKIIGRNAVEYTEEKVAIELEQQKRDIIEKYSSKEKYTLEESTKLTVEALTELFTEKLEGFEDYEVVAVPIEFFHVKGMGFNLERKNVVRTEKDFEVPYMIEEEGEEYPSTVFLDFIQDLVFTTEVDSLIRDSVKFAEERKLDTLEVIQRALTLFYIDKVDNFEPYKVDVFKDEADGKYTIRIIPKDEPFSFQCKPENGAGEKVINNDK